MVPAQLLDVLLALLLLVYLGEGWRNGLVRSLSAIVGIFAGGLIAFLGMPLIAALIPSPLWRTVATVGVALGLLVGGHAAGAAIGNAIRGRIRRTALRLPDRILGALANVVSAALVASLLAGGVAALGVPVLSSAVSGSVVLGAIDDVTPEPVQAALARVRSAVLQEGLPAIGDALGGIADSPGAPDIDTGTDALTEAAASVVRISGTAYACGQNQSGTGFVVSPGRVVTNAHVVAGVDQPIVEAPNGQSLEGRVVYFDPDDDLAVIAVDDLRAAGLPLSEPLEVGEDGVVEGYPYGGPFSRAPAEVLAVSQERIRNVYGDGSNVREVYSLAAEVKPGNSGGPLLALDGEVAGVVFAKSANQDDLGYAMTNAELRPVVEAAPDLRDAITPGTCVKG